MLELAYGYFKVAIINMFKELKIKMVRINDRWGNLSREAKKDQRNSRHEKYNI